MCAGRGGGVGRDGAGGGEVAGGAGAGRDEQRGVVGVVGGDGRRISAEIGEGQ